MKQNLSNERIVTKLLECGSVTETARQLGCNRKTLYERMAAPSFKEFYSKVKGDMLRTVTAKLQNSAKTAVDTLQEVLVDPNTNAQTRVYCAVNILQYAAKFTETVDIIERLDTLEAAQQTEGAA